MAQSVNIDITYTMYIEPKLLQIPTPCSVKRCLEDVQPWQFHKRARVDYAVEDLVAAYDRSLGPYEEVNSLLQRLHAEKGEARRQLVPAGNDVRPPVCDAANGLLLHQLHVEQLERRHVVHLPGRSSEPAFPLASSSSSHISTPARFAAEAKTFFCMADVVRCCHGLGGRCLQCAGRQVQQVPLSAYSVLCAAFPQQGRVADSGLSLPALSSLLAEHLQPLNATDRFLHLGSGAGHAVLFWALLCPPSSLASGVEACPLLHGAAIDAAAHLDSEMQRRVFLHRTDNILATQGEWHQAKSILLSADCFPSSHDLSRIVEGLSRVASPGTRVASLARPLCTDPRRAPPGFILVQQSLYRNTKAGNTTVFVYHKVDE